MVCACCHHGKEIFSEEDDVSNKTIKKILKAGEDHHRERVQRISQNDEHERALTKLTPMLKSTLPRSVTDRVEAKNEDPLLAEYLVEAKIKFEPILPKKRTAAREFLEGKAEKLEEGGILAFLTKWRQMFCYLQGVDAIGLQDLPRYPPVRYPPVLRTLFTNADDESKAAVFAEKRKNPLICGVQPQENFSLLDVLTDIASKMEQKAPEELALSAAKSSEKKKGQCWEETKNGSCTRRNCEFQHSVEQKKGTCWEEKKIGSCTRRNCEFQHSGEQSKTGKTTKPCRFFQQNKCHFGDKCRFQHVQENAAVILAVMPKTKKKTPKMYLDSGASQIVVNAGNQRKGDAVQVRTANGNCVGTPVIAETALGPLPGIQIPGSPDLFPLGLLPKKGVSFEWKGYQEYPTVTTADGREIILDAEGLTPIMPTALTASKWTETKNLEGQINTKGVNDEDMAEFRRRIL